MAFHGKRLALSMGQKPLRFIMEPSKGFQVHWATITFLIGQFQFQHPNLLKGGQLTPTQVYQQIPAQIGVATHPKVLLW